MDIDPPCDVTVLMTKAPCDDIKRQALLDQQTGMCVTQHMRRDGSADDFQRVLFQVLIKRIVGNVFPFVLKEKIASSHYTLTEGVISDDPAQIQHFVLYVNFTDGRERFWGGGDVIINIVSLVYPNSPFFEIQIGNIKGSGFTKPKAGQDQKFRKFSPLIYSHILQKKISFCGFQKFVLNLFPV